MIDTSDALFADGGVIGKNPSNIGGTWAFCHIKGELWWWKGSNVITPTQASLPAITNNLTEMLAVVRALQSVPATWAGTVYSDSAITLGRVFEGWKWKNIPLWLHQEFQRERKRLVNWEQIRHVLLQGHPTRSELEAGIGKSGRPVSQFNVFCDQECGRRADEYMAAFGKVTA